MRHSRLSFLLATAAAALLTVGALRAQAQYSAHLLPLTTAVPGGLYMDYIAYDRSTGLVWAPAGNTGTVYIVDTKTEDVKQLTGFATKEVEIRGRKRTLGPTAATVGKHVVYVGNRADASVCAFDALSFAKGACVQLDSMPDGLAYVEPTREVWVTTPRDHSIRILDAETLAQKTKLSFDGNPEGFAVDATRHRFYTNLEDKDKTLAIDLRSHKTMATWNPSCGSEGPHGLRTDSARGQLFVVCDARAEVLDAAHRGKVLSTIDTGDGVDDLDYDPATHKLYVGAAKDGKLTIANVSRSGKLSLDSQVPTHAGARNPVVAKNGTVYLAHSMMADLSDLVVVSAASK
jgi:DNA-binding beta-propeller fold protein YncE